MAKIKNLVGSDESLTSIITTRYSASVEIDTCSVVACQIDADVNTPVAKAFAPADVNTTDNTITETNHGYVTGLKGQFTTVTTLPAGLSPATDYFVIRVDANTYKVATSLVNALAGTAVDITDQGTDDHTFTPAAIAGANAKFQQSLDGTNWVDLGSATNITADTNFILSQVDPVAKYMRVAATLTAGMMDLDLTWLGKGIE